MSYTSKTLKELISIGCNITVESSQTSSTIKELARLAVVNKVHLTIKSSYTSAVLKEVAIIGGKNVTIVG